MVFRPALPPGALLTRHDATRLRIGVQAGLLVPDTAVVRAVISSVDGVSPADAVCAAAAAQLGLPAGRRSELHTVLGELIEIGAIVDASALTRLHAPRNEIVAAVLRGLDPTVTERRSHTAVALHASAGCGDLADLLRAAMSAGGLALETEPADVSDLFVVITLGEPRRDAVATATMAGSRVLPVALIEGRCVIGPWIVPGRTPCLDCADLNRIEWDPAWSRHRPSLDRPDRPHGVGVDLMLTAAGLVTSEIIAIVEGRRPRTTAACLAIGPEAGTAQRTEIAFHPACTCHLLAFEDTNRAVS